MRRLSLLGVRPHVLLISLSVAALLVLFFTFTTLQPPAQANGTPEITNVSGTATNGATITLSGENFGSHSLDISSSVGPNGWIEQNANGTDFDNLVNAPGWDVGLSSGIKPIISNLKAHSGSQSAYAKIQSGTNWQSVLRYEYPTNFDSMYASWWVYFDPIALSGEHTTQWKMWRINDNGGVDDNCSEMLQSSAWNPDRSADLYHTVLYCLIDNPWPMPAECYENIVPDPYYDPLFDFPYEYRRHFRAGAESYDVNAPTPGQWNRYEMFAKSSTLDVADGEYELYISKPGQERKLIDKWSGMLTHRSDCARDEANPWTHFMLQNYFDDNGGTYLEERADMFYDDIYLQFGTQARVEIGSQPVYENNVALEVQEPTAWSDTSVSVRVNYGALSEGETAYLFVVADDGSVSDGYPLTLGEIDTGVLLYSKLDSDNEVFAPSVFTGQMPGLEDAVFEMNAADITYEPGADGDAAVLNTGYPDVEKLVFEGSNFDLSDLDGDGGRIDWWMRFDEDPHAITNNRFLLETDDVAAGSPFWNLSMETTSSGHLFTEFQSGLGQPNVHDAFNFFRITPTGSLWDGVQAGEWHLYTLTWRRNQGENSSEIHFYIDGTQDGCGTGYYGTSECNRYNGNLPDAGSFSQVRFGPHFTFNNPFIRVSIDELWSFDTWDIQAGPGTYADLTIPEATTLTYPIDTFTTEDDRPVFSFIAINHQYETFSCDLYVDDELRQSDATVTNNMLTSFISEELVSGAHTWYVSCDEGRLVSPVWSLTVPDNTLPVLASIQDKTVTAGETLNFEVLATDDDLNDTLVLTANTLPTGATFTDNGDGSGVFNWTPGDSQIGAYPGVVFIASDGEAEDSESVTITVEAGPPDCTPDWTCSAWSICSNSLQTRTCTDQNGCGTDAGKPATVQACDSTAPGKITNLRFVG